LVSVSDEAEPAVVAVLIEFLEDNTIRQWLAMKMLGDIGSEARAAVLGLLRIYRENSNSDYRVAALDALDKIDPPLAQAVRDMP
jgi:HEAT repeat protein